jgi:hypothetical protein
MFMDYHDAYNPQFVGHNNWKVAVDKSKNNVFVQN